MVYGDFLTPAVDEEHPLNSIGIYGALKVAGEKIVAAYDQVFGLQYTIVRPSALYGPRCISRRVSQLFIEDALAGESLRVQGDGSERLDFTYVDDLVQGLVLVLDHPDSRRETFNLTYGESRSISELAGIVEQHFPGTEIEHVQRDKLMPVRGTLSVEKARKQLGYAPANPLEVGIEKYVAWYRELVPAAPIG
jgi:nucleoside-diphosphate-sugar epimerase